MHKLIITCIISAAIVGCSPSSPAAVHNATAKASYHNPTEEASYKARVGVFVDKAFSDPECAMRTLLEFYGSWQQAYEHLGDGSNNTELAKLAAKDGCRP